MTKTRVRIQAKDRVTVPRHILKKFNLKRGDFVIFDETEAGVMVEPSPAVSKELRAQVIDLVRLIRMHFKHYTADEIVSLVDESIRKTREEHA